MGIIDNILMSHFWEEWQEKFENSTEKYINPDAEGVLDESKQVNFDGTSTQQEVAKRVWVYVAHEIRWRLTKEWQEPEELIRTRIGDCEDMCFLMLSMFPHVGVDRGELVIGDLIKPNGGGGPHVWIEVEGKVMDPTGMPEDVNRMKYKQIKRYNMEYEKLEEAQ